MTRRIVLGPFYFVATGITLLLTASAAGGQTVLFVDDSAPRGGDGSSWDMACRFLQDGLAAAAGAMPPVEVRVAQGTYKPDRTKPTPTARATGARPSSSSTPSHSWAATLALSPAGAHDALPVDGSQAGLTTALTGPCRLIIVCGHLKAEGGISCDRVPSPACMLPRLSRR